jgi:DNA-binding CsgD family transcriptional regulator
MGLSERTLGALRWADRRLRGTRRGDRPSVYRTCRIAMEAIAQVDAFYVALIKDDSTAVFPYTFDQGVYVDPDVVPYGRSGLTHWIKSSRRTYRWSDDAGALVNRGVPFGEETEMSRDALVVPLFDALDRDSEVVGMMCVQSYSSGAFTDEHQEAFEWLAGSAMITIARGLQDQRRDQIYSVYPELDSAVITNLVELAEHVGVRLGEIRRRLADLVSRLNDLPKEDVASILALIDTHCENLQIEAADASLVKPVEVDAAPIRPSLTRREEDIVDLIALNRSNREIAHELGLSEKTVKSHVTNILKKFNVAQRSAVAWQVRSWAAVS